MFKEILSLIARLRAPPAPAGEVLSLLEKGLGCTFA